MDELLETLALTAEVEDLKANPERAAAGTVIEAHLDKRMGAVTTLLVQTGTLRVGDVIQTGGCYGKVTHCVTVAAYTEIMLLVQLGTFRCGDVVQPGGSHGRVRASVGFWGNSWWESATWSRSQEWWLLWRVEVGCPCVILSSAGSCTVLPSSPGTGLQGPPLQQQRVQGVAWQAGPQLMSVRTSGATCVAL